MRRAGLTRCLGFSVVEVTLILTILSLLSAATAPAIDDYVNQAKLVKAHHDVRTLSVTLIRFFSDTASEANIEHGWATYDLLAGPGTVPQTAGPGTEGWAATERVGLLDDHLLNNTPGYSPGDSTQVPRFGWRGAYLQDRVGSDPWGHRFAFNVRSLKTPGLDTVVLTAGPNGTVESLFEIDGLPNAGDDVAAGVSAAGH